MRHAASVLLFSLALANAVLAPTTLAQEAPPAPSLKGKFLAADPSMPDPRFAGTVIFMIAHSAEGAVGVVINRPGARRPVADVMRAFGLAPPEGKDAEIDLHWGGPVEGNHVLLLHSDEYKAPSTVAVAPGVGLSLPKEALDDIAAGKGPQRLLLAVGYAGWSPGQLERELEMKSWAVIGSGPDLLFDADAAAKWRRAWALKTQEL
jgi:putative transcriptional regulator